MITAKIKTKSDISQDEIVISGDSIEIAMLLTLLDSKAILKPNIGSPEDLGKKLKRPPKSITVSLGHKNISKATLLAFLDFAEVK